MSNEIQRGFPRPVKMNIQGLLMYEDGYRDPRKVIVKPLDEDRDGVPDDPTILEQVVQNFEAEPSQVFFRKIQDFDGYEYLTLWRGNFLWITGTGVNSVANDAFLTLNPEGESPIVNLRGQVDRNFSRVFTLEANDVDLLVLTQINIDQFVNAANLALADVGVKSLAGIIVASRGRFYELGEGSLGELTYTETTDYASRVGRSFSLNRLLPVQNPLHFLWKHYAPRENRIDPSISNIIDMFVITNGYFREVQEWKNRRQSVENFPRPPTSESLRVQFGELNQFKMLSDEVVFRPGQFKLLFGQGAEPELQARFKVVKLPSTTLTDNEVKSRVIDAVESYFQLENWDFGERFYYTELSAYIHQRLSNIISTVVIVPEKAESAFGNLFQIRSEVNELFLSTATVSDVDIVSNLTETNLRVRRGDLFPPR